MFQSAQRLTQPFIIVLVKLKLSYTYLIAFVKSEKPFFRPFINLFDFLLSNKGKQKSINLISISQLTVSLYQFPHTFNKTHLVVLNA